MPIDLRTCKPGQKLKSTHGMILEYVGPMPEGHFYDHQVKYPDGAKGTRIHDGHVYRNEKSRLPDDHDIAEILPLDESVPVAKDPWDEQIRKW